MAMGTWNEFSNCFSMRLSTRGYYLLILALPLISACGLVHREKSNEPPKLQAITADTLKVARGGRVELAVLANDEDDDPLFYRWDAFGAGGFSDTTCVSRARLRCNDIIWFAPGSINSASELFLISVLIRDRQCDIIDVAEARGLCEETVGEGIESIIIEVVQSPPTVNLVADTTVTLDDQPVTVRAQGQDEENDALVYVWEQTNGEVVDFEPTSVDGGSQLGFTPIVPGDYSFRVTVDDDAEFATAEVTFHVLEEIDSEP
jgi:hypothetical protein